MSMLKKCSGNFRSRTKTQLIQRTWRGMTTKRVDPMEIDVCIIDVMQERLRRYEWKLMSASYKITRQYKFKKITFWNTSIEYHHMMLFTLIVTSHNYWFFFSILQPLLKYWNTFCWVQIVLVSCVFKIRVYWVVIKVRELGVGSVLKESKTEQGEKVDAKLLAPRLETARVVLTIIPPLVIHAMSVRADVWSLTTREISAWANVLFGQPSWFSTDFTISNNLKRSILF